ncbi:MAG: FAD-dependent oxidoreductase [Opitutales bacterium]|nr:FAD-dependent oxidoreductase [Opitutales bacterium]
MQSIAIIGSGISGLGAAWFLHREFDVTVFEAADYPGGHTCTVTVDEGGRAVPIDTGFMVFNHVTYPHLTRLFQVVQRAPRRHRPRIRRLFAQPPLRPAPQSPAALVLPPAPAD